MNENIILTLNFILLVLLGLPIKFIQLAIVCYPIALIIAIIYIKLLKGKNENHSTNRKPGKRKR